jgi:hypothetical protein
MSPEESPIPHGIYHASSHGAMERRKHDVQLSIEGDPVVLQCVMRFDANDLK